MTNINKPIKTIVSDWRLVANSEKKIVKSLLNKTTAVVLRNRNDENNLIARVTIGQHNRDFIVDKNCDLQTGELIEPSSIRVYNLVNKDGVMIERLWGEVLVEDFNINNSKQKIQEQVHKEIQKKDNRLEIENKKQEVKWITVKVNPNPLVDFSGDDLSLDPRFW